MLTQPAVSKQLALLEREVGLQLVERGPRGVRLTDAGPALASHAEDIVARLEVAERDLRQRRVLGSGHVRLGAFPTAFAHLVPATLAALASRHPLLRVEPVEIETDQAERLVGEAHVDLAVLYTHALMPRGEATAGLRRIVLLEDPMLVALPAGTASPIGTTSASRSSRTRVGSRGAAVRRHNSPNARACWPALRRASSQGHRVRSRSRASSPLGSV